MRDRSLTLCTCVHRLKSPSFQNVFDRFEPEIQTKCLFFSLTARQSCWRSASFATPICMQRMSSACKCLEYLWIPRIETDAGYHQWPKWDKNDKLQTAPLGDFYYWGREARPCTVRSDNFHAHCDSHRGSPTGASTSSVWTKNTMRGGWRCLTWIGMMAHSKGHPLKISKTSEVDSYGHGKRVHINHIMDTYGSYV